MELEKQAVEYKDLGVVAYKDAWEYQEELMQRNVKAKLSVRNTVDATTDVAVLNDTTRNYFLLCEHPPVYTLGKNGNSNNILISQEQLLEKQIEFYQTNRGGDITFHGPQQIVGYPILDLEKFYTDIGRYLYEIEEVIILTIAEYGIKAGRSKGETGVWLDADKPAKARKICAIGIRCSRWITMHGFALNVNTDLSYFNNIIPCGITNKQVTSVEKELGHKVDISEVKEKICRNFQQVFNTSLLQ